MSFSGSSGIDRMSTSTIVLDSHSDKLEQLKEPMLPRSSSEIAISGSFEGQKVQMRQRGPSEELQQLQAESRERLDTLPKPGFGRKALTVLAAIVAAPVKLALGVVGATVSLIGGGIIRGAEKLFGLTKGAEEHREHISKTLGQKMPGSVLDTQLPPTEKRTTQKSVAEVLDDFRISHLGGDSRISKDEMLRYIATGERLMAAINNSPDGRPPLSVTAPKLGVQGETETFQIHPGIDSARAISWYLQAKALADNAGTGQDILLKEGAMVAKDPGNKLFNFLNSSENSYGRVSSHMQERSSSVETGFFGGLKGLFKGGVTSLFGVGFSGQPLQRGIEDFGSKMPSKGGTLLFDKLNSSTDGGQPEIYLKWEAVGMPTTFNPAATHDNDSLGNALLDRAFAFGRCIKHSINFIKDANPATYRGEKMEKGKAKEVSESFGEMIQGLPFLSDRTKDNLIKSVNKFGAAEMLKVLDKLRDLPEVQSDPIHAKAVRDVRGELLTFMGEMGTDMGIARKGGEVHVKLS
jgi:hypothetical protein